MSVMKTKVDNVIQSGRPLRVAQAAWLLNVSVDKVYAWIQEGLLEVLPGGKPFRVSTKSVLDMLKPVYSSFDADKEPEYRDRTALTSSSSSSSSSSSCFSSSSSPCSCTGSLNASPSAFRVPGAGENRPVQSAPSSPVRAVTGLNPAISRISSKDGPEVVESGFNKLNQHYIH